MSPAPARGMVVRVRLDPTEGRESRKTRPAVGRLRTCPSFL